MNFLISVGWYIIPFVLVLSVLIFVHEFGHYIVAKWCKVKVEEFSLGFGKKLFSRIDKSGTEWKVCAIPFGGYVKMFGDADAASTPDFEKIEIMSDEAKAMSFQHKKVHQKMAIIFAGPFFNYLFAILLFVLLFMTFGQKFTSPFISKVQVDSPAEKAGIQVGDEIVFLDGKMIEKFEDIKVIVGINFNKTMDVIVNRNGQSLELEVTPQAKDVESVGGQKQKTGYIGIFSEEIAVKRYKNPIKAFSQAVKISNDMIWATLKALGQIIVGTRSGDELGGPIKIAQLSKDFASAGVSSLIFFIAVLSVNLALINLFPIPVLDGGHLLFYFIELLIRKPVNQKVQTICYKVGMFFIIGLAIIITINDVRSFEFIKNLF